MRLDRYDEAEAERARVVERVLDRERRRAPPTQLVRVSVRVRVRIRVRVRVRITLTLTLTLTCVNRPRSWSSTMSIASKALTDSSSCCSACFLSSSAAASASA